MGAGRWSSSPLMVSAPSRMETGLCAKSAEDGAGGMRFGTVPKGNGNTVDESLQVFDPRQLNNNDCIDRNGSRLGENGKVGFEHVKFEAVAGNP